METLGLPFQSLVVWQKAIQLCDDLFEDVERFPREYQFNLGDQLRRAVLSIPTNIAEGAGRDAIADRNRFFVIAKGSAFETVSLLEVARRRKCLEESRTGDLMTRSIEIVRMLVGLIKSSVPGA